MATLPSTDVEQVMPRLSLDEAAAQMARLVEDYYDEIGLSEQERDQRVASAGEFIQSVSERSAKSA